MAPLPVTYPSDPDFESHVWQRVFNKRQPGRAPTAVVRARSPADVAAAVRLARDRGWRVSARSGGHSWAVWSVRPGALMVDLRGLIGASPGGRDPHNDGDHDDDNGDGPGNSHDSDMGVEYDEATGVAGCGTALTGEELNMVLAQHGRFFAGGHCPTVGLGGFVLQGGMGWNAKNWGYACESLVALEAVTADGELIRCSETENADLLWAARGAGPGFPAIATRFYVQTRAQAGGLWESIYSYPATSTEVEAVLAWVVEAGRAPDADGDTEVVCVCAYPRPSPPPAAGNGVEGPEGSGGDDGVLITVKLLAMKDGEDEARSALQPLHDSRPPGAIAEAFCVPTTLAAQYAGQRIASPVGLRNACDNVYLDNSLSGRQVGAVLGRAGFAALPSRTSWSLYFSMYPVSRRPAEGAALSAFTDHYVALYGSWADATDDGRCRAWVRETTEGMERGGALEMENSGDGGGAYSYLGDADFAARRPRFWADEQARRLGEVRRRWDPEGRVCGFLVDDKDAESHRADELMGLTADAQAG